MDWFSAQRRAGSRAVEKGRQRQRQRRRRRRRLALAPLLPLADRAPPSSHKQKHTFHHHPRLTINALRHAASTPQHIENARRARRERRGGSKRALAPARARRSKQQAPAFLGPDGHPSTPEEEAAGARMSIMQKVRWRGARGATNCRRRRSPLAAAARSPAPLALHPPSNPKTQN
jgi:hypothetical protein